ncbi:MAG: M23 family metallopeptidase [Anaerolineae bacterium]|nr:M23 family metallopeptidase [Anaerolineae bacterium]
MNISPPLTGSPPITQTYADHIAYGKQKGYKKYNPGIDYAVPTGTPVYACCDGRVQYVNYHDEGYGRVIYIDHDNGYISIYAHLDYILVTAGQSVSTNQMIARSGSTGRSTGPHLHFEIRYNNTPIDPADLLPDVSSPLLGGNEKGGEGEGVRVGSIITPIYTSFLRSAPKVNASTATALIRPGARLRVLDVLQLDGNTWLKVEAYIALTYENNTLCKLAD